MSSGQLNAFMHERNIYKNSPPDFLKLSEKFSELKPFLNVDKNNRKGFLNFNDPDATRVLAICLLKEDFNLNVVIPNDRLAPTVPLRLNYLLWIEDLLSAFNTSCPFIIDIGTGASCIYPMLGTQVNKTWQFLATEKDEINYNCAIKNVENNSLSSRIKVMKVNSNELNVLPLSWKNHADKAENVNFENRYAACMCNPPFYNHLEEQIYVETKGSVIAQSCCGSPTETITHGGDLGFALKIYNESLNSKTKICCYTIMMGKKSSFKQILKVLKSNKSLTVSSYEFCQGRTIRWGVAWSFNKLSEGNELPTAAFKKHKQEKKLQKPILLNFGKDLNLNVTIASQKLADILSKIDVSCSVKADDEMEISASKCTWQNIRKRKRSDITNQQTILSCNLQSRVNLKQNDSGEILAAFTPLNNTDKQLINGLVVYIKRILSETN